MLLCRRGSRSSCRKHRASLRARGGSAAAKKAWASGERITSNIGAHLAPVHALARSDRLLGGGQTLRQRRTIQELNKFSQRHQALGRQAIDVAFDPAAEFNGAH